jgi:FlaA1/EpsC-like NDP-sugar epimerase
LPDAAETDVTAEQSTSKRIAAAGYRFRRSIIATIELGLIVLSKYLACWLRFDGDVPDWVATLQVETMPWLLLTRGLVFIPFRLYEGLWRYTGLWDLRNLIAGVVTSSAVFYGVTVWGLGYRRFPRSVYVVDALLLIFLMGGLRLTRRLYRELVTVRREKRVLIFGAGDAGEMIVRDMKNNPFYGAEPIGFLDDDPDKTGMRIHGVPVLGTRDALAAMIRQTLPNEILVAIPSADPSVVRGIVRVCEPFKIPITTLPSLRDIIDGSVTVSEIRGLRIEDLLSRAPVGLDPEPLRRLISGKCVLVTGAGGSIGSELSRQICELQPRSLLLLDRYENTLHSVFEDASARHRHLEIEPVIADVTDARRIDDVFSEAHADIVFHTAAHKHVPMMEFNACEAVKNNVRGTRVVMTAAAMHGVEKMILISSDKAVNPVSVMGATKAVAERMIQHMDHTSATSFAAVRFGNVLGSNGSVVPKFIEQIKLGGPVTVTHPAITRYFMLIPEAVQLVLYAATLAQTGGLFVLDMGEQMKVLDLARDLIRLSGFVPEEIPIEFVGLRPGEKLHEELIGKDEWGERSAVEKIHRVCTGRKDSGEIFWSQLSSLEQTAERGDRMEVLALLEQIVPNFRPAEAMDSRPHHVGT